MKEKLSQRSLDFNQIRKQEHERNEATSQKLEIKRLQFNRQKAQAVKELKNIQKQNN